MKNFEHLIVKAEEKSINWYPGHMARAKRRRFRWSRVT